MKSEIAIDEWFKNLWKTRPGPESLFIFGSNSSRWLICVYKCHCKHCWISVEWIAAGVGTGIGFTNYKKFQLRIRNFWKGTDLGSENVTPITSETNNVRMCSFYPLFNVIRHCLRLSSIVNTRNIKKHSLFFRFLLLIAHPWNQNFCFANYPQWTADFRFERSR